MARVLLEQFGSIVDFFFSSLEVELAVGEVFPQFFEVSGESVFVVDGVVELMSRVGEVLLKLYVFPGCFFVLVEVVFELGDLILELNVLIVEPIGLI